MPHSNTQQPHTPLQDLSFEEALTELEKIVRDLEGGKMTLENALTAYERGATLRRHCEARLGEAEMRVKAIVQNADGSVSQEPLTNTPKKRTKAHEETP